MTVPRKRRAISTGIKANHGSDRARTDRRSPRRRACRHARQGLRRVARATRRSRLASCNPPDLSSEIPAIIDRLPLRRLGIPQAMFKPHVALDEVRRSKLKTRHPGVTTEQFRALQRALDGGRSSTRIAAEAETSRRQSSSTRHATGRMSGMPGGGVLPDQDPCTTTPIEAGVPLSDPGAEARQAKQDSHSRRRCANGTRSAGCRAGDGRSLGGRYPPRVGETRKISGHTLSAQRRRHAKQSVQTTVGRLLGGDGRHCSFFARRLGTAGSGSSHTLCPITLAVNTHPMHSNSRWRPERLLHGAISTPFHPLGRPIGAISGMSTLPAGIAAQCTLGAARAPNGVLDSSRDFPATSA